MAMHIMFSQTLGEWVKWFLLLNDLFLSWQISIYSSEYLQQTLRQKSNTCIPLCLVCKFGSSVTLFSNLFFFFIIKLFDVRFGFPSLLVHYFDPCRSFCYIFSPIFQGYCSGIFMIKYWVVRILFRFVLDSANSKRNNGNAYCI